MPHSSNAASCTSELFSRLQSRLGPPKLQAASGGATLGLLSKHRIALHTWQSTGVSTAIGGNDTARLQSQV